MDDKSDIFWSSMSDKALIETIGTFIQHNRLDQNKSQSEIDTDIGHTDNAGTEE